MRVFRPPPTCTLFPYTTLFRSLVGYGVEYFDLKHQEGNTVPRWHQPRGAPCCPPGRSEEHTSELQSHSDLVCRLLLAKKDVQQDLRAPSFARAHAPHTLPSSAR